MKIFKLSYLLSFCGIIGLAGLLYWTSQSVQHAENILNEKRQALTAQVEAVNVLNTEWDYLTRPQRLEELAREKLNMVAPTSGDDMIDNAAMLPDVPAAETIFIENTPVPTKSSPTISNAERENFESLIGHIDQGGTTTP